MQIFLHNSDILHLFDVATHFVVDLHHSIKITGDWLLFENLKSSSQDLKLYTFHFNRAYTLFLHVVPYIFVSIFVKNCFQGCELSKTYVVSPLSCSIFPLSIFMYVSLSMSCLHVVVQSLIQRQTNFLLPA